MRAVTLPRPPARPLAWVLAATLAAAVLSPPETSGSALAGLSALVLLAAVLAATSAALSARAGLLLGAAGLLALATRFASDPGPAVLPAAMILLGAIALAVAAAAARAGLSARHALSLATAGAGAWVGARAVYEAAYGLGALAERVRADAANIPDAELVLGRLEQGRAYAGFPTPAAAGGFLALAIPVTAALAAASAGKRRWLLGAAAALQIAGLVATRSLTAAAALLGALALAALVLRSRRVAIAAGAVVLAIAILAALRAGQVLSRQTDDSPWALRLGNVRIGLAIAADHPWKGVGPGGYAEAFASYRGALDNEARHAHCLPAELLADLGIPIGSVAALAVLVLFLSPVLARSPVDRGIAIALAGFAIHNLADFTFYLPSVLIPAVLLRGSLSEPAEARSSAFARVSFASAAALSAVIVALSGLADDAVDRATEAAREGRHADAAAFAERARTLAPWSAEAAIVLAQADAASGRTVDGLEAADRAVALAPDRASIREVRARLRAARGDIPGAYADLARAAESNPRKTSYADLRDRVLSSLP
jgi:tetratricopeptide (TPR) repeat protein